MSIDEEFLATLTSTCTAVPTCIVEGTLIESIATTHIGRSEMQKISNMDR